MTASIKISDTATLSSAFLAWPNLSIGINDEPLITSANITLQTLTAPPFAWTWNRSTANFQTVQGVQDYAVNLSDFGYLETASVQMAAAITSVTVTNNVAVFTAQNNFNSLLSGGAVWTAISGCTTSALNGTQAIVRATPTTFTCNITTGDLAEAESGAKALAGPIMPLEYRSADVLTSAAEQDRPAFICDLLNVSIPPAGLTIAAFETTSDINSISIPVLAGDNVVVAYANDGSYVDVPHPSVSGVSVESHFSSLATVSDPVDRVVVEVLYTVSPLSSGGNLTFSLITSGTPEITVLVVRGATSSVVDGAAGVDGTPLTTSPNFVTAPSDGTLAICPVAGISGLGSPLLPLLTEGSTTGAASQVVNAGTVLLGQWSGSPTAAGAVGILAFSGSNPTPGSNQITFRLLPVPNTTYQINLTYQKAPAVLTSTDSLWGVPDQLQYIYSYFTLFLAMDYFDDERAERYRQLATTSLLARAEGLDQQDRNLFLGNWLDLMAQEQANNLSISQGARARGL